MSSDPIADEIFRHLFISVAEEMGVTLERTAYSPNIKERRDHSCALFDREGRLVAQAAHDQADVRRNVDELEAQVQVGLRGPAVAEHDPGRDAVTSARLHRD